MRKLLGLGILCLCAVAPGYSLTGGEKETFRLFAGPSLGIVDGKAGAGGSFGMALPVGPYVYLGIETGYYRWEDANRAIPLLATVTYYFDGGTLHPYFGLALGATFVTLDGQKVVGFQGEIRPGVAMEIIGTNFFIENKVGFLNGNFLIAPSMGISVPF